jgi:DNA-directed RNA polymerases I, II, and III subunit RPABC1
MNHNNNNSQQTPTSLSPEASRLFRVYRTISSMLDKRGYMVPRDLREMTPSSFISKFGDQPSREGLTILVVRVFYRSF